MISDEFFYKKIKYFIEDGKYFRLKYGKRLNVKKKDFYKIRNKANEYIQRNRDLGANMEE